jgi:NAD(P)-dependent dehydrogenase (short-subunit alcohol dehydrogenase family)
MEELDFTGQVVVVSGAGRGLGQVYAHEFARRGAHVVVNDWAGVHGPANPGEGIRADTVTAEIRAAGGSAIASYDDVGRPEGGVAVIDAALREWGTVDVVVSNAGLLRNALFGDMTRGEVDAMLYSHLHGAFNVLQPAWRVMTEKRYGRIVIVSSSSGMFSHQGSAAYAAAKAGLFGLGRALAYESTLLYDDEPVDIKVNSILPMAKTLMTTEQPIPQHSEQFALRTPAGSGDLMAMRGRPEVAEPLVTLLAARECPVNGESISSCMGRYGRVFVGIGDGWTAPEEGTTAEELLEHLEEIRDLDQPTVPASLYGEIAIVARQLLGEDPDPADQA